MSEEGSLDEVEALLGHRFSDRALLERALTHKSHAHEHDGADNERMEFLGDAVLELIASERIFRDHPDADEGDMTRRRAAYVSEPALAARARDVGLGDYLRVGRGERKAGGHQRPSLLSDAVEAVLAAVYLDGGLDAARSSVENLLGAPEGAAPERGNPKTELQERLQGALGETPDYDVERQQSPDHAPRFRAEVRVRGHALGTGDGGTIRAATREAAASALETLGEQSDDELRRRMGP